MGYHLLCHHNESVGHPTATSNAHTLVTIEATNSKRGHANQTSSNHKHEPSTHGSSRCQQATATPSRSTTSESPPLSQLPIPLPLDLVQNRGVFVPHQALNQLSNTLQHLTSSM